MPKPGASSLEILNVLLCGSCTTLEEGAHFLPWPWPVTLSVGSASMLLFSAGVDELRFGLEPTFSATTLFMYGLHPGLFEEGNVLVVDP